MVPNLGCILELPGQSLMLKPGVQATTRYSKSETRGGIDPGISTLKSFPSNSERTSEEKASGYEDI